MNLDLTRRFPIVILIGAIVLGTMAPLKARGDSTDDCTIRLSPLRLTLGALDYGDRTSAVLVREVKIEGLSSERALGPIDLSHAPGVQVLDLRKTGDTAFLRIGINVAQFTKGEPFGLFLKRPIRLETTSPDQPQLILPVIGWTAVNRTSRDFNDYLFVGHKRWQGLWGTPNIAGSVLAPLSLLILGVTAALFSTEKSRRGWLQIGVNVVLLGLFGTLLAFLVATYSRGAWVAFFAGALVLMFSTRLRWFVLCGVLTFVLLVFFLPSGLNRLDSYAQVQEDPSISHRLKLWLGALQIMGDHPSGVGLNQFGPVFECNYQRFDHVALNSTAVSDYLTTGAECGIFFLSAFLGSILFVLFLSLRTVQARDNPLQLTLSAALSSILVASTFSTLSFVPDYQYIFAFIVTGLLIFLVWQRWRSNKRRFIILVSLGFAFVGGCFVVLKIMALSSLFLQPTQSSDISINTPQGNSFSIHRLEPRWQKAKGLIIYFKGEHDSLPVLCHSTLRPLAALGWQVWSPDLFTGSDPQIRALVASIDPHCPTFVAGQNEGGRLAWSTAAHFPNSGIRAGAGLDFLTMDLDPLKGGLGLKTPFLVFQYLYDDHVSAKAAILADRRTAFTELPLTIRLSPEEPGAFSSGNAQWVECLDGYFSAHRVP